MVNQEKKHEFTKIYSYFYRYRYAGSGENEYLWNTSTGFTIPMDYSSIGIWVETAIASDVVTASVSNSLYTITKVDNSFFILSTTFNQSTTPGSCTLTFSISGTSVTKSYPVYYVGHHLEGYVIDDSKVYTDLNYLRGARVVEVASTATSYTCNFYSNECDHITGSYDYLAGWSKKMYFASDTRTPYSYTNKGVLINTLSYQNVALIDQYNGKAQGSVVWNTDSAFSVSMTHPDNDPDLYSATVSFSANTSGHTRYFLLISKSNYYNCPVLLYQKSS